MIIGLFPMVADILHTGHSCALKEAKNNCDYLIVALNTKPEYKNPVESVYERFIKLDSIKYIDKIIPYEGKKDLELLCSTLNYNIRFLGTDYLNKDWDGKEIEIKKGIKIYYINRELNNLSSTSLKERIKKN